MKDLVYTMRRRYKWMDVTVICNIDLGCFHNILICNSRSGILNLRVLESGREKYCAGMTSLNFLTFYLNFKDMPIFVKPDLISHCET